MRPLLVCLYSGQNLPVKMRKNLEQINLNLIPMKWFKQKTFKYSPDSCKSSSNNHNCDHGNVPTLRQIIHNEEPHPYTNQHQQGSVTNMEKCKADHKSINICDNNCCRNHPLRSNSLITASSTSSTLSSKYLNNCCKWQQFQYLVILLTFALIFLSISVYYIWLNNVDIVRKYYLESRKEVYNAITADENVIIRHTENVKYPIITSRTRTTAASTILQALSKTTKKVAALNEPNVAHIAHLPHLTSSYLKWEDGANEKESATLVSAEAAQMPIKFTRFTSGHQNSFGISIEDDERILKLFNGRSHNNTVTTVANAHTTIVKVYPTIPQLRQQQQQQQHQYQQEDQQQQHKFRKQQNDVNAVALDRGLTQENGCYSTSLDMCRGVLGYDLTYNFSIQLGTNEMHDYQMLIESNCSSRSLEFLCVFLEPECRSAYIGVLPPCRRICKAILEDCSIVIANSDILTAIFDCNLYPDSNDPHRCDDPTKRKNFCYNNEFQCYDHSCIPQQWQCDNIKDCSSGEDESQCLICDQVDEFRCKSNDKCIPAAGRCDHNDDCSDGSDEDDCNTTGDNDNLKYNMKMEGIYTFNTHTFPYSEYLLPNQTNNKSFVYTTISGAVSPPYKEDIATITTTTHDDKFHGFVNFHDGKEIMITSDSENRPKFSSVHNNNYNNTVLPSPNVTTINQSLRRALYENHVICLPHQLRCISGKCITVDDLCDKKIDCPDGSDERTCEYKKSNATTTPLTMTTATSFKNHNSTFTALLKKIKNVNVSTGINRNNNTTKHRGK